MQITVTWQTAITAFAVASALAGLVAMFVRAVHWVDRQKQQDEELKSLKEMHMADMEQINREQTLIIYGLLACLKGLQEQGCNGPVTDAINKIEKHINQKAHHQKAHQQEATK